MASDSTPSDNQETPDLLSCLRTLEEGRRDGRWLEYQQAAIYPHEHAQLVYYIMHALGHQVSIQRQLFSIEGPKMKARGTNSTMKYGYCVKAPGIPGERADLAGRTGDESIFRGVLNEVEPEARFVRPGTNHWLAFDVPDIERFDETIGQHYRITPDKAKIEVQKGLAVLAAQVLDAATVEAQAGAPRGPRL